MGQAKRRGSFEERKAMAVARADGIWAEILTPVDLETFRFAFEVWVQAGSGSMPVENPGATQVLVDHDTNSTWRLTDVPINRAGCEVSRQLRDAGVSNIAAYMMRLMHLGQLFDERNGLLAEYFKEGEKPGTTGMSEALIDAMALAEFVVRKPSEGDDGYMGFNILDVAQKAKEMSEAAA